MSSGGIRPGAGRKRSEVPRVVVDGKGQVWILLA